MGRRAIRPGDDERWVFNRLAADYAHRPGYPAALADRLAELAGGPGASVADLGAGTGHLAIPLAARGLLVDAVEPARAMREALAAEAERAGVELRVVAAAAEDTGLPRGRHDLVLVADALHWIDPDRAGREAHSLLAPGGACAVVEAALADTPFLEGLRDLLAGVNPRARRASRPRTAAQGVSSNQAPASGDLNAGPRFARRGRASCWLRPSGFAAEELSGMEFRTALQLLSVAVPGGRPRVEPFEHEARLDDGTLDAVLRSLSYVGPALGPDALASLLAAARALAAAHGGAVWSRALTLTWARRAVRRRHRTG